MTPTMVERARELLVTELRCDGAHLLAGVIENLNDGAILSNPPTSSAIRAIVKALQSTREPTPIPMLLFCPQCHLQHIDEPDPDGETSVEMSGRETRWDNPPHRSHLCHGCGCIWRPADVPTNGVASIQTRGKADTWLADGEREALPVQGGEEERARLYRLAKANNQLARMNGEHRDFWRERAVRYAGALEEIADATWPGVNAVARIQTFARATLGSGDHLPAQQPAVGEESGE